MFFGCKSRARNVTLTRPYVKLPHDVTRIFLVAQLRFLRGVEARVSPSAATLAWSEPLTTLPRSVRSRVSSSRSLCKAACEDTLASPFTEYFVYAREARARSPVCGDLAIVRA